MANSLATVVIADSDSGSARLCATILAKKGFNVIICAKQPAFRKKLRTGHGGFVALLGELISFNALAGLRAQGWMMPAIVLRANPSIKTVVAAMQAGADDFLPKPVKAVNLIGAVLQLVKKLKNQASVSKQRLETAQRAASLTWREREIIALVLAGKLNKQIAEELGLALVTVKLYRGQAMKKMGVRTAGELARVAREFEFTGLPEL